MSRFFYTHKPSAQASRSRPACLKTSAYLGLLNNAEVAQLEQHGAHGRPCQPEATSLVEIGYGAFSTTDLGGTLVIPAKVTTIGYHAFKGTKLTGASTSSEISSN